MAIDITDLFDKLAPIVQMARNANGYRASTAPYPDPATKWGVGGPVIKDVQTAVEDIATEFNNGDFEYVIEGIQTDLTAYRAAHKVFLTKLQTYYKNTILEVVNADTPLSAKTITKAVAELVRQMDSQDDTVNASTVAATVATAAANTGDGVCAVSVKNEFGLTLEYLPPEDIVLEATSDVDLGATEGQEPFDVTGEAAQSDTLSYLWPGGSGASTSLTALDAASDDTNLLSNAAFNTFTVANTPDDWTIQTGVAGTDIFSTTTVYGGAKALEFRGTGGAPLSQIWQSVLADLEPNTVYALCFRARKTSGLVAGVLSMDLYNGTAVIADDATTSNLITTAFGALTTAYVAFKTFFITPKIIPATARFRIHVSTALTSGESIYVDHVCFKEATRLYTSAGPWGAVFSGATSFVKNDRFTVSITNTWGVHQEWAERFLGMRALGYQLLSSASSETITDPS